MMGPGALLQRLAFLGIAAATLAGLVRTLPLDEIAAQAKHALMIIGEAEAQSAEATDQTPMGNQEKAASMPAWKWSPFPARAAFETGDRWIAGGKRYRLFGVQSCLRGSTFTNKSGARPDCGEASISLLSNLLREARAQCATVTRLDAFNEVVICQIIIGANRYDLGAYLTLTGWSFAAVTATGDPVYLPYFVNELSAKKNRLGLWQFADLPHPTMALAALRKARGLKAKELKASELKGTELKGIGPKAGEPKP